MDDLVIIAEILKFHGIKGKILLRTYTDKLSCYDDFDMWVKIKDQLYPIKLKILGNKKGNIFIASFIINNFTLTHENQVLLNNTHVFISRSNFPVIEREDEFYYTDLVGMKIITDNGVSVGEVESMHDFGAGDVICVTNKGTKEEIYLSFTKAVVKEVNHQENFILIYKEAVEGV